MRPDSLLFALVDAMLEEDAESAETGHDYGLCSAQVERAAFARLGAWRALWWG